MAGASPWGGGGMDWGSLPSKPRDNLPASVPFKGRDVAIYTFAQIDRLGKKTLKDRAMNLRDLVGAENLPRFSPGMPDEQMVAWLLEAQTIVAGTCGISLTVADLGAPKGGDGVGAYLSHLQNVPAPQREAPPPQQQYEQQQYQQQQYQQQQYQQQQYQQQALPPPPQEEYQVEGIVDVRTDPSGIATHFLIKWVGYPIEESTWEPAVKMQAVAPDVVFKFKQRLFAQQQQRRTQQQQHFQQQQHLQPQQPQQQQQHFQTSPVQHQRQQYQPTDLRGNPLRSPQALGTPQDGSPMRPDQEADLAREAARKRNMGSNPFG